MEREKGFESQVLSAFSRTCATSDGDARGSTRPLDASGHIPAELHGGYNQRDPTALPTPTAELFIMAGVTAAERAASERMQRSELQGILRRALDQAAAVGKY